MESPAPHDLDSRPVEKFGQRRDHALVIPSFSWLTLFPADEYSITFLFRQFHDQIADAIVVEVRDPPFLHRFRASETQIRFRAESLESRNKKVNRDVIAVFPNQQILFAISIEIAAELDAAREILRQASSSAAFGADPDG